MLLVTNNGKVRDRFGDLCTLRFVEGDHGDVLQAVLKPNETPYRSVALTEQAGTLDLESLQLIEGALATYAKFKPRAGRGMDASPSMKEDFAEIDLRLIAGAIEPHLDI